MVAPQVILENLCFLVLCVDFSFFFEKGNMNKTPVKAAPVAFFTSPSPVVGGASTSVALCEQ